MADQQQQEKQYHRNSPEERMRVMEEMSARNLESDLKHREEMGMGKGYIDEKSMDDIDASDKQNIEDILGDAADLEKKPEAVKKEEKPKAKVMAKVDGVEEEVDVEKLLGQYQKYRHAEKEMEKAALARKELELGQRELAMQRQQMLDMHDAKMKELESGQAQSAKQAEKLPSSEDAINKAVSNLFTGDEKQAAQSLQEAINARVNAELERRFQTEATKSRQEAEKISQEVVARSQNQMRWETAISQIQSKIPEFKTDEDLAGMFEQRVMSAAKQGATPEEAVSIAAKQLERFLPKQEVEKEGKKEFKVSDADLRETEAKKADNKRYSVDGKAVAVSGSKKTDEDRELTREEIIAQLRKRK